MSSLTQQLGYAIEAQACAYLERFGLKLVTANYRCKVGEIDLIMRDLDTMVFVEVRYRQQEGYGGGVESITRSKQRKIIRAAMCYLVESELWEKIPCRFDVIIAQSLASDTWEDECWIKDAFRI